MPPAEGRSKGELRERKRERVRRKGRKEGKRGIEAEGNLRHTNRIDYSVSTLLGWITFSAAILRAIHILPGLLGLGLGLEAKFSGLGLETC